MTFEEFERLPYRAGKQEWIRGEVVELPPAIFKHSEIAHRIWNGLDAALDSAHSRGEAGDLGETYHQMGYYLSADAWLQPDVSVTHTGQTIGEYLEGAPAIAVEVVSPANTAEELDAKTELYFQFGVLEVWRVYPKARHIVVHTSESEVTVPDGGVLTTPLLPVFELPVAAILD